MRGKNEYKVSESVIIYDAPASALMKNIKGHNGHHGCEKCTQPGIWKNTALPSQNIKFGEMVNEEHPGRSTTKDRGLEIKLALVTQFLLDYMHLVCLAGPRHFPMRLRVC